MVSSPAALLAPLRSPPPLESAAALSPTPEVRKEHDNVTGGPVVLGYVATPAGELLGGAKATGSLLSTP
jgi:hypothetical protein